ncbi:MAG: hypothetical protein ACKVP0_12970 [Pirellulaceae bacterium]
MARLYGRAVRRDGSRINGTATISTSWNNNKAYPQNGQYSLELGSNPRQTITVYVDGNYYGEISVDGDQPYDIEL